MSNSPVKKRKATFTFWVKLHRLIHFFLGIMLTLTAYLQIPREDAIIWVTIFLVPAFITLLTSLKLHFGALPQVKVVSSVHIACCLFMLVYLGIRLIHGITHQQSNMILYEDGQETGVSYNPMNYQEGWEIMAIILLVGWMKFLAMSTMEHMKEFGIAASEVSPLWMLKAMGAVVLVPLGLASFCYIESLNNAAKIFYGVLKNPGSSSASP